MIQVSNKNNQLEVTWANNLVEYYAFEDMKSVTPYIGQTGEFIVINFINENRNSSLRLPYSEISNQPSWTTLAIAVADISDWMDDVILQNIQVNTTGVLRTPNIIRPSNSSGNVNTVATAFYSVSVANVGTADGSVLGGTNNIKPGEVLNFSGDALNNYFTSFAYNATGTEFIIIFVS